MLIIRIRISNTDWWFLLLYKRAASSVMAVSPEGGDTREEEEKVVPRNALQMWTDDDLATLAKYIKKFPGGTVDRFVETIFRLRIRRILSFLSVVRSRKYFFWLRLQLRLLLQIWIKTVTFTKNS
jgi:hypothetical protein